MYEFDWEKAAHLAAQGEVIIDHHAMHEFGMCHADCPWCAAEHCDLGGEG